MDVAIDQVDFMYRMLDTAKMLERISLFVDLLSHRGIIKYESKYILCDVFVKGKTSKSDAMRITNTSDKTLKAITDSLIEKGLLIAKKEGIIVNYYPKYAIQYSPMLFPNLYPQDKELDMMELIK